MEAVRLLSKADAENRIKELAKIRADGGPDHRGEAVKIAGDWGIKERDVQQLFDEAERLAAEAHEVWIETGARPKDFFKNTAAQPERAEPKTSPKTEPMKPAATVAVK